MMGWFLGWKEVIIWLCKLRFGESDILSQGEASNFIIGANESIKFLAPSLAAYEVANSILLLALHESSRVSLSMSYGQTLHPLTGCWT